MKTSICMLLAAAAIALCTPSQGLAQDFMAGRWSDRSGIVYNLWPVGEPDANGQLYEGTADFSNAPGYLDGSWLNIHGYWWELCFTGGVFVYLPGEGPIGYGVNESLVFWQQPPVTWCGGSCAGLFSAIGETEPYGLLDVWLKAPPSLLLQPSRIVPGGCFGIHVPNAPYLPLEVQYSFNGGGPQLGSDPGGIFVPFEGSGPELPIWQQLDVNGDAQVCVKPEAATGVYEFSYIWNPLVPLVWGNGEDVYFAPTPIDQTLTIAATNGPFLSKEYIYLGGRILAIDQP